MTPSAKPAFRILAAIAGLVIVLLPARAGAHVGSPDVVLDANAGPYAVGVTIVPPTVVPGIAAIEVRALDADVDGVAVVPVPLRGEGVASPPVADIARRSDIDPRLFLGQLWLMQARPWQVRVTVTGPRGQGAVAVPVPALASGVKPMPVALGALLVGLLALLVAGALAIVAAAAREADLAPGAAPDASRIRRGRTATAVTAATLAAAVAGGALWWRGEASSVRRRVFKPLRADVQVTGRSMRLDLVDPGWVTWRRVDDLVPDHGHLMHLFLVRTPALDAFGHLHPVRSGVATFEHALPDLPAGSYRVFADVVHATGLDETATASIDLVPLAAPSDRVLSGGAPDWVPLAAPPDRVPLAATADREVPLAATPPAGARQAVTAPSPAQAALSGGCGPSDGDDAVAIVARAATQDEPVYRFADAAGQLRWSPVRPRAGDTVDLEFRAESPDGAPLDSIEAYMGMAGHAMIVARDLSVFAHIHPNGSVPMASLMLVEDSPSPAVDHSAHHGMRFPSVVRFPYRFPRAGDYRVFVQIKTGGRIETAAFDVHADAV